MNFAIKLLDVLNLAIILSQKVPVLITVDYITLGVLKLE